MKENMTKNLIRLLLKSGFNDTDIEYINNKLIKNGYLYVDINDSGKNNISYLPKEYDYINDKFNNNHRQITRIGRLFGKINIVVGERRILIFNSILNKYFKKFYFEIVSGEDIRKYYLQDNYETGNGTLNNSCMRYSRCQFKLDIYVNNPSVCKMIKMKANKNSDKIIGRALLWETNKGKFMDRVYTLDHSYIYDFYYYANERHYIYKNIYGEFMLNNTYISKQSLIVNLKDNRTLLYKFIDLFKIKKNIDKIQYPYLDNLRYFNYKDNTLSNDVSYKYTVILDEL